MDFSTFQAWFCFLQYQFFIRAKPDRNAQNSRIAKFLRQLVYDPLSAHIRYRVEPDELSALKRPKGRPPKSGIRKSEPLPLTFGKPILFRAKQNSIRNRFLLFNVPTGYRKDDIAIMLKCLFVHDMAENGLTPYSIAKLLIQDNISYSQAGSYRNCYNWYDDLTVRILGTQENREDLYCNGYTCLSANDEYLHESIRSRLPEVKHYIDLSSQLVKLSAKTRFKKYLQTIRKKIK